MKYEHLNEFRNKTKKPEAAIFRGLYDRGLEFAKEYETFYNDHYGFRDIFIKLKNQIDYSLFHRSDELIKGRDGYFFYRNVVEREQVNIEREPEEDYVRMLKRFIWLNSDLRSRGITLILVPIPLKNSVYPELISAPVMRPANTRLSRFIDFLRRRRDIQFIDTWKMLDELKPRSELYYRTDFHWNEVSAFNAARELVDRIGVLSGSNIRWDHKLRISYEEKWSGGQNRSLAIFRPPLEAFPHVEKTWKECGDIKWEGGDTYMYRYKANGNCGNKKRLPETIILGDSYFESLPKTGFPEYFSEVTHFPSKDTPDLYKLITRNTKYVVVEFIEVTLIDFLFDQGYWPDRVREAIP
jgi:alginate O-acetyltransferase complex protein AlgJ